MTTGKRFLCAALALLLGCSPLPVFAADTTDARTASAPVLPAVGQTADDNAYRAYAEKHAGAPRPQLKTAPAVGAAAFTAIQPDGSYVVMQEYQGRRDVLLLQESLEYVEYTLEVPESGLYMVAMDYCPMDTGSDKYEFSLKINDAFPFSQSSSLFLTNMFGPEKEGVTTDSKGNQFASKRVVRQVWQTLPLRNPDGNSDSPLYFYFEKGANRLRLSMVQADAFVLGGISLLSITEPPTYADYLKQKGAQGQAGKGTSLLQVEAESAVRQSDSTLRPAADHSDKRMSPSSVSNLLMNMIDSSWSVSGQWLEWDIEVAQTGFYRLSFRYRQDALKGLSVGRRLYLDGAVPYQEADYLRFPYAGGWKFRTMETGGGEPLYLHLTAGRHTIRMEVVLNELTDIVRDVDDIVYDLNALYRKVIMVTSNTVDQYRDYHLETEIPSLLPGLKDVAARLRDCHGRIGRLSGGNESDYAILMTMVRQLEGMLGDARSIPSRLSSLQTNIGSLSAWVSEVRSQPLGLDYILLHQDEAALPVTTSNLWDKISFGVSKFALSFFQDYNQFGSEGDGESITLWMGAGRDQAQVMYEMVGNLFTPRTGIHVDIKLVSATIVEAFLSGQAPDVALGLTRDTPVNLAVRSALVDLSSFSDFGDVPGWFSEGALTPYTFQGGVYGLPDTQTFHMMFYRKDIMQELGLPIPQTWDELGKVASQLHLYKLDVGVPLATDISSLYYAFLLQHGGRLYNDNLSRTLLDTDEGLEAFRQWTGLYTEGGLPLSYDAFNRFRSGEMPLLLAPYTLYSQLVTASPEIRNMWDMAEIPGIMRSDGSIDRSQSATGTAAVILSATDKPGESWKFLKWWAGEEAQTRYASDIESRMGTIARVAVANKNALKTQGWSGPQLAKLVYQQKQITELPQVPGNYYLDRDLTNAFRQVVYNGRNAMDTIMEYSTRINGEIERKREEFGLE